MVPEDGVAAERAAAEYGRQAPAVERLIRRRTGSSEVEDRRRDVGRDHGVAFLQFLDDPVVCDIEAALDLHRANEPGRRRA